MDDVTPQGQLPNEMESYKILHVEMVDKREVTLQSPNMEHEAFVRSLTHINRKVTCNELVQCIIIHSQNNGFILVYK